MIAPVYATVEDVPLITKIADQYQKFLPMYITMRVAVRDLIEKENSIILHPSKLGFLYFRARKDGVVVVYDVAVDKTSTKKGIGKELMQTVESITRDKGLQKVELVTTSDNETAVKFYTALGYNLSKREKRFNRKKTVEKEYLTYEKIV